jgi:hypothetical protein
MNGFRECWNRRRRELERRSDRQDEELPTRVFQTRVGSPGRRSADRAGWSESRAFASGGNLQVCPLWRRLVLQVMNAPGPGQGAKAATVLWRVVPADEWERLEAVYDRLQPPSGWRRL